MAGPVIVGITGASGAMLARAMVDELLRRDLPTAVGMLQRRPDGVAGGIGRFVQRNAW